MSEFNTPEAELAWLRERLAEAQAERDEAVELVSALREQLRADVDMIDAWIEVFDMSPDERGIWTFDPAQTALWAEHDSLLTEHRTLVRDWNRFVPRYNATVASRPSGRPLAASEAQIAKARGLREAGKSLRQIAADSGLSLRTVRSIVDTEQGGARDHAKQQLRKREFDRLRAAAFRARKRRLADLPKGIASVQAEGARLLKAAQGLAKR